MDPAGSVASPAPDHSSKVSCPTPDYTFKTPKETPSRSDSKDFRTRDGGTSGGDGSGNTFYTRNALASVNCLEVLS